MLVAVPACPTRCDETATPAGHQRCSSVTRTDRVVAERECQEATGFLHVRAGGRQTSVLVRRERPAMIWIDSGGRLLVEQEGMALRGLSSGGAVLLTSVSAGGMPAVPAHVLRVSGGLLLLVGLALLRVLFSIRRERVLARGVAGHIEQGRFFPTDNHLGSVAVDDSGDLGPALLLGDARSVGYRSGGGQVAVVVRGSAEELVAALRAKRLMTYALSLAAVSFALVGIASDLSRLH